MNAHASIVRKLDFLGTAKDFDRLSRLVEEHLAVIAMAEMAFELLHDGRVQRAVDVVREFADDALAIQFESPRRK